MDIIARFNLPTYVKGKSFSEASAIIAKRFKDRNSPEDVATLNELQGRLQQAQDFVKAEQEKRSKPQAATTEAVAHGNNEVAGAQATEQAPTHTMPDGTVMEGAAHNSNSYFFGGSKDTPEGSPDSGGPGIGAYTGAASAAFDLGKQAFGPTGIDTSGSTPAPSVPSKGSAAASGAMKGAAAGASFGPWGAAIGGVVGGVSGLIGGGKAQKDALEAEINYTGKLHNDASNSYKYGGSTGASKLANMYQNGGPTDPIIDEGEQTLKEMRHYLTTGRRLQKGIENPIQSQGVVTSGFNEPIVTRGELADQGLGDRATGIKSYLEPAGVVENLGKSTASQLAESSANIDPSVAASVANTSPSSSTGTKFNPAELLRYAPAAMNAAQLAGLKKPESIGTDRLGNKYNEQLVDERGLQNTVQESVNNARNAILSSSGGSGSTARANLLASQLQGAKALSSAYQSATAENRQEKRAGQAFDLNVDQANIAQANRATDLNLEQEAAYRTNKSKLLAQLGQDLGGVGTEEMLKKFPELMGLSYDPRGRKIKKKKTGTIV